jgi:alanine or glycine:cation symporter, AGCS family
MRRIKRLVAHVVLIAMMTPALALAQAPGSAEAAPAAATAEVGEVAGPQGIEAAIDQVFGEVVGAMATVLFWKIPGLEMPFVVAWLLFGAVFFTLRMGFVNIRLFRHAIDLVRGQYDDPDSEGEVTHFQALATALSATVGLGNIAGVAIAIATGGPGATFWMLLIGFFGMTAKFTEVTLGQKYRQVRPDGRIMGGAMFYLSRGLEDLGKPALGKVLAVLFAILCIGGSFGGGNAFQVVQSLGAVKASAPWLVGNEWMYGLAMSFAVGVVIIGGIQRIAQVADKIVPAMCGLYVLACIYIILTFIGDVPAAIGLIFTEAFDPQAVGGGFIGVMVIGIKRAVFSNEAGIGSAAIAHSAAKVKYPVEEGVVSLLEPFIDTIVVCTMTALVIILTGAYGSAIDSSDGAALTSQAMGGVVSWFPHVLSVAVLLFAFSTMISWSYYGERCWAYLFGDGSSMVYRLLFLVFTFLGSIVTATNILDFSDLMILAMAFPNILGVLLLSGGVRSDLTDYLAKLESGEIKKVS